MRIGLHVRTGKGLDISIRLAAETGCETIQIFASNPNAWKSAAIGKEKAASFRQVVEEYDLHPITIHTPYLLNLATTDQEIYTKSIAALSDALLRAEILGAEFVVTHIGSHKGAGFETGSERVVQAVTEVLDRAQTSAVLLLENSAGAGDSVGSHFEELDSIINRLGEYGDRLGICLDTAHLWGAGYDLSGAEEVEQVFGEFDSTVGLSHLRLLHLNDTKVELGSRRDRHANIGTGHIGVSGFASIVNLPALASLAGVIETPPREDEKHDIAILKGMRIADQ